VFRFLLIALAFLSSVSFAGPKYVGKKMTFEVKSADYATVFRMISDVSRKNVVLFDEPSTATIDLAVDQQPWDQVLDEVVARSGLRSKHIDNLVLVGTPSRLQAFSGRTFTGRRLSVNFVGADVRDAAALVAQGSGLELGAGEGARRITTRLRNVPADLVIALLVELANALPAGRFAMDSGCAASDTPLNELTLLGTVTGTAKPLALIGGRGPRASGVGLKECLGAERDTVKTITADKVISAGRELSL
jgi:hypothetical protein